jgi:hypothetical protein
MQMRVYRIYTIIKRASITVKSSAGQRLPQGYD